MLKMAMSREIPINVHPEFRWRSVIGTNEEQGKPRTQVTRSYSLPCEPRIFLETSNPNVGEEVIDPEKNTTEISRQGLNDREKSENGLLGLTTNLKKQKYNGKKADELFNEAEEREQRRHFFEENPVVGDLLRVFEEHYTSSVPSRPIKLGRRNTYGPECSGESHLAPAKLTRRNASGVNRNETSFSIPIYIESVERKKGTHEIDRSHFSESAALEERDICEEQPTKKFSDGGIEQVEPKSSFDEEIHVSIEHDNKDQDRIDEEINDKREEYQAYLHQEESNIDQSQRTIEDQPEQLNQIPPLPPRASETEQQESKIKLLQIERILEKADDLAREVHAFSDSVKTKEYLILEEVLTCCLIELDTVEANQDENVRVKRKKGVQIFQRILAQLEEKIKPEAIETKERDDNTES